MFGEFRSPVFALEAVARSLDPERIDGHDATVGWKVVGEKRRPRPRPALMVRRWREPATMVVCTRQRSASISMCRRAGR